MTQNILIVDDDPHISDMVSEALRREGYVVSKAYSGTEAVMILSRNMPDLILLDLMLPGLSGEVLLTKIIDIPVIVVSAKADTADKVGLLLGGAADTSQSPLIWTSCWQGSPFSSAEILRVRKNP